MFMPQELPVCLVLRVQLWLWQSQGVIYCSYLHCLIDHQWPTGPTLALAAKTKKGTLCVGRKTACLPYPLELIPLTVIQLDP